MGIATKETHHEEREGHEGKKSFMKTKCEEEVIKKPSKPTGDEITRALLELRECVETTAEDRIEARLAQMAEAAIMWATQETASWPSPRQEVRLIANILRGEI